MVRLRAPNGDGAPVYGVAAKAGQPLGQRHVHGEVVAVEGRDVGGSLVEDEKANDARMLHQITWIEQVISDMVTE